MKNRGLQLIREEIRRLRKMLEGIGDKDSRLAREILNKAARLEWSVRVITNCER